MPPLFLSSSSWRLFAHLCDTLPAEWNFNISTYCGIRINGDLVSQNMGMWTHELQSGGSKDVIIKFFPHCFKMVLELGVFTWLIGWCFKHVFKYYPRFWHSLFHKCFWLRNDLGLYIHDLIFSITHHALKEMQFPFGGCPLGDLSFQWYQE